MRKILYDYTEKIADLVVTSVMIEGKIAGLKEQSAQKDGIIEALRAQINRLNIDLGISHDNLQIAIKKGKSK
ncbi:MAG: hypothetical protein IMZ56_01655 [Candidatus Atribacteria bacterium]|nr:hypothetical protein [Candidatus Atribacteria bacterium]